MFGSLGPLEIMIIFVIVLVVFGADRLPELARGLGKGIREFKRAADDVKREIMIDPDLNLDLDLNEPLPKETKTPDDPYKQNDWENKESEATKKTDETNELNDKNEHDENEADEAFNIESEHEKKLENKEDKKKQSEENNFSEKNSGKQDLAG